MSQLDKSPIYKAKCNLDIRKPWYYCFLGSGFSPLSVFFLQVSTCLGAAEIGVMYRYRRPIPPNYVFLWLVLGSYTVKRMGDRWNNRLMIESDSDV